MSKQNDFTMTDEILQIRSKKKKMSGLQIFFLSFIIFICVLLAAGATAFAYFKYLYKPSLPEDGAVVPLQPKLHDEDLPGFDGDDGSLKRKDDCYTFLVVGCDRRQWLSDVIMLARYDVAEKTVAIMQIPRDTYVTATNKLYLDDEGRVSGDNFDGGNGMKINAVLGHGGAFAEKELERLAQEARDAETDELRSLCEASFLDIDAPTLAAYLKASGSVKQTMAYDIRMRFGVTYLQALLAHAFGVPADYFAQLNLDGFVNIVDAVGGVDIYVQEDMNYDDPFQDLHIHIKKGQQHMDGKTAEGFVRFRYGYAAADIARIDAQKIFMTAFIKKVMSLEGVLNMNDLVTEVGANLSTNLSFSDALYFATNALDVDLASVVMLTMPGSSKWMNGVSYYSIDKATMMEHVNLYLNKYTTDLAAEHFDAVEIAAGNDSTPPLTAEDIDGEQPNLGFMH